MLKVRETKIKEVIKNMLSVGDTGYYIAKLPSGEYKLTAALVVGVRVKRDGEEWLPEYEVQVPFSQEYSGEQLFRTPEYAFKNEFMNLEKSYKRQFGENKPSSPDRIVVITKSQLDSIRVPESEEVKKAQQAAYEQILKWNKKGRR